MDPVETTETSEKPNKPVSRFGKGITLFLGISVVLYMLFFIGSIATSLVLGEMVVSPVLLIAGHVISICTIHAMNPKAGTDFGSEHKRSGYDHSAAATYYSATRNWGSSISLARSHRKR